MAKLTRIAQVMVENDRRTREALALASGACGACEAVVADQAMADWISDISGVGGALADQKWHPALAIIAQGFVLEGMKNGAQAWPKTETALIKLASG